MMKSRKKSQSGQAMVESILVVITTLFCFLALFQYGNVVMSRFILSHASARAARSRTVGMNRFMASKAVDIAAIPASGKRLVPNQVPSPPMIDTKNQTPGKIFDDALKHTADVFTFERNLMPDYLAAPNLPTAREILDYEGWQNITLELNEDDTSIRAKVSLSVPMFISRFALLTGDLAADSSDNKQTLRIAAEYEIENHASLYLESTTW